MTKLTAEQKAERKRKAEAKVEQQIKEHFAFREQRIKAANDRLAAEPNNLTVPLTPKEMAFLLHALRWYLENANGADQGADIAQDIMDRSFEIVGVHNRAAMPKH